MGAKHKLSAPQNSYKNNSAINFANIHVEVITMY